MDPARELGKLLLVVGSCMSAPARCCCSAESCRFAWDVCPATSPIRAATAVFYFPIVTCIVLSVALTLIIWIVNFFRR